MLGINRELVHKLAECIHVCNDCLNSCLEEEDVKMMAECIRLDKDCAEICSAALSLVHRDARFSDEILMLCKNACIVCAQECAKFPHDHCQKCAQACRECADICDRHLKEGYRSQGCQ